MGERLRRLTIEAFRGVPERWELAWPGGRSMVIWGPNGSGKSTVADALEWFFAGRIDFLAREGRDHALRNQAARRTDVTRVTVATDGRLGDSQALADRAPGWPWTSRRVPDNFVLRGRTLSDFVEQPKAEKYKTLAPILGLQDIDHLRLDLQTVYHQLEQARADQAGQVRAAATALRSAVGHVSEPRLLAAIAERCRRAGVDAPVSLAAALAPAWTASLEGGAGGPITTAVAGLKADLDLAAAVEVALDGCEEWNAHLADASTADPRHLRFVQAASAFITGRADDGRRPLCGQEVDTASLEARIVSLLGELETAAAARQRAERGLRTAARSVHSFSDRLAAIHARASGLGLAPSPPPAIALDAPLLEQGHAAVDVGALRDAIERGSAWIAEVRTALEGHPAAAVTAAPMIELVVLVEAGRRWYDASVALRAATEAAGVADRLHTACAVAESTEYRAILARISARVAELYSALHPDEGLTGVAIEPWTAKGVELALEFHGTHQRPPHGVLSESHLNSLAVALFLAMAEMFNERLDTIVLDDVVNSFDIEHRGRLAELLVTQFRARQVIVLTHDVQFRTVLTRLAPDWLQLDVTSWSFDEGPREARYATGRLLAAAEGALAGGDVVGAGQKGRRALEELLDEACEEMAAPLPFRRGHANDRRELNELLSGLRGRMRSLSRSWAATHADLLAAIEADAQAVFNVEAHAGRGASSRAEVAASLQRIASLDAGFTCDACHSRIWHLGSRDAGRCRCGACVYPPRDPAGT